MDSKETITKAYGNIPRDVGLMPTFDIFPFRSIKYYWTIWFKRRYRNK
jgi:hypothetical protein